jgi:hypothetical protein
MNSFRFNGQAGHCTRYAIVKSLKINFMDLYKIIKNINNNVIELKDGKKYELVLVEITNKEIINNE